MTEFKRWKTAGASVQGLGHIKDNIPCQDYVATLHKSGVTAIALSDGVGSRKLSHFGAETVVNCVTHLLTEEFDPLFGMDNDEVKHRVMEVVLDKLAETAKEYDVTIRDLSSTLLFCGIKNNLLIVGQLGDGIIGCLAGDKCTPVFSPEKHEFANITYSTTSENAETHLRLLRENIGTKLGYILMSDGSAASLYHKQSETIAPAVYLMFDWLNENNSEVISKALKESLENTIRLRTRDDCSIAMMRLEQYSMEMLLDKSAQDRKSILGMTRIDGLSNMLKVLDLAIVGKKSQEIADQIQISEKTVQKHLRTLKRYGYLF